ncbi:unnamed protein product [Aureobasidium vineae]|uniref:UBC core domain-containing protein n=1 Tax=Aureobasidium vineae TaxID=2773715 RepID=A0A9N8JWX4_9PEZI|nr:unnamed protein product [Aureobasidium vineae]
MTTGQRFIPSHFTRSGMSLIRIARELSDLQRDPFSTGPVSPASDDDPRHWVTRLNGPPNSPYANGVFAIDIQFLEDYPRIPPHMTFLTPVFHPNVSAQGDIRLAEFVWDQWCPAITIRMFLLSIQAMLSDPNLLEGCILNEKVAALLLKDKQRFEKEAREWTVMHAV